MNYIHIIHRSKKLQLCNVKKYLKNADKTASYDDYNAPKMPENALKILFIGAISKLMMIRSSEVLSYINLTSNIIIVYYNNFCNFISIVWKEF